ncbi:MAG: hypothetical protein P1P59_00895 [Treponemataceae bacterium]
MTNSKLLQNILPFKQKDFLGVSYLSEELTFLLKIILLLKHIKH